jgi:hypothetical protein
MKIKLVVGILLLQCCSASVNFVNASALPAVCDLTSIHIDSDAKILGMLKVVEDSGYPFATVTIEHADGQVNDYTINLEEVKNIDMGVLTSWIGSEVAFNYASETFNALLDIFHNGHSILYEEEDEFTEEILAVEGILSGAEYETTGDLPGEIYITTVEEVSYTFPFFIDVNVVAANGRNVTGYFEVRTINYITSIRLN